MRAFATCLLFAASIVPAAAQNAPDAPTTVAVVVSIPVPPGTPRTVLDAGIRQAVPTYRRVPGLLRKYFTASDRDFGGVYLFTDRTAAERWFGDAWRARIAATYHATATLTYYDVPVVLDNEPVPAASRAQP